MKKAALILLVILPAAACAQGGCVNSPENPTLVLFLIGTGSALLAGVRTRLRR